MEAVKCHRVAMWGASVTGAAYLALWAHHPHKYNRTRRQNDSNTINRNLMKKWPHQIHQPPLFTLSFWNLGSLLLLVAATATHWHIDSSVDIINFFFLWHSNQKLESKNWLLTNDGERIGVAERETVRQKERTVVICAPSNSRSPLSSTALWVPRAGSRTHAFFHLGN